MLSVISCSWLDITQKYHIIWLPCDHYRPYDCNLCSRKFFFRAELENHSIDHENGRIPIQLSNRLLSDEYNNGLKVIQLNYDQMKQNNETENDHEQIQIKSETQKQNAELNGEDDDEYIEVEQLAENASVGSVENNCNSIEKQHEQKQYHDNDKNDETPSNHS